MSKQKMNSVKKLCYSTTFYLIEELPNRITVYDYDNLFCGIFKCITIKDKVDVFMQDKVVMISNVTDDELILDMNEGVIYSALCE